MIVPAELEDWFKNKIKENVLQSYKLFKEKNFYGGPEENLFEYFESTVYIAVHLTEHKGYEASSIWFEQNGCPYPFLVREKHHLMARLRDGNIGFKDLFG